MQTGEVFKVIRVGVAKRMWERILSMSRKNIVYVHTPKHGSWLNLVETLFGKMASTFLRHIRVDSKAELKERIMQGIAEINASPAVHRWSKFGESSTVLM